MSQALSVVARSMWYAFTRHHGLCSSTGIHCMPCGGAALGAHHWPRRRGRCLLTFACCVDLEQALCLRGMTMRVRLAMARSIEFSWSWKLITSPAHNDPMGTLARRFVGTSVRVVRLHLWQRAHALVAVLTFVCVCARVCVCVCVYVCALHASHVLPNSTSTPHLIAFTPYTWATRWPSTLHGVLTHSLVTPRTMANGPFASKVCGASTITEIVCVVRASHRPACYGTRHACHALRCTYVCICDRHLA